MPDARAGRADGRGLRTGGEGRRDDDVGAAEAGPRRVTGARGRLWLADIGVSPEFYANPTIGMRVRTQFNESDLIKLAA